MVHHKEKKDVFDYIHPITSKYVKPLIDISKKHPIYGISLIAIFIILFFVVMTFFSILVKAIVIALLIIIGGFSKLYQRYWHVPVGFELVMFSTVIAGFLYGAVIGIIVGLVSFAMATYLSQRYNVHAIISFIIYIFAGAFAHSFSSVKIAGLVFSLIFVAVLVSLSIILNLSRPSRTFMFAITSLGGNFVVFYFIAPKIVSLFI